MRLTLISVGRLKAGPERDLCARYIERFSQLGDTLGFSLAQRELTESPLKRPDDRKGEEAAAIAAALPAGCALIALDERGKSLDSEDFARKLAAWRDAGRRDLALVIGGADGLADPLRARADLVLSFGALTLPHQLVRVLVAEQLYRAATILKGHPYHRS